MKLTTCFTILHHRNSHGFRIKKQQHQPLQLSCRLPGNLTDTYPAFNAEPNARDSQEQ